MKTVLQSLAFFLCMTVMLGIIYPALVTGISFVWPNKRAGSMITYHGNIVGSSLIAQKFTKEHYFWPRPSASDFVAVPSGASNFGPTSKDLKDAVTSRRSTLAQAHHVAPSEVPDELLFQSGSGLDPHILPNTALFQLKRVARARGLRPHQEEQLAELIEQATESPIFSVLGPPVVNVLMLNMATDQAFGTLVQ